MIKKIASALGDLIQAQANYLDVKKEHQIAEAYTKGFEDGRESVPHMETISEMNRELAKVTRWAKKFEGDSITLNNISYSMAKWIGDQRTKSGEAVQYDPIDLTTSVEKLIKFRESQLASIVALAAGEDLTRATNVLDDILEIAERKFSNDDK